MEGASLELEAIQHTGPAVRKQSTLDTYVQLAFLVSIEFRGLSQRMVPHTVMIHNQCNQDNPPTERSTYQVFLDPIDLTAEATHHKGELCGRRRVTEDGEGWVTRHGSGS